MSAAARVVADGRGRTGRAVAGSPRYTDVVTRVRAELCGLPESGDVLVGHVAGLIAWAADVRHEKGSVAVPLGSIKTAQWLAGRLPEPAVDLDVDVEVDDPGAVVRIRNPQTVLGRYGYRRGRWMFGSGLLTALGVARGAVHAAGVFNARGDLVVPSPSVSAMLTVTGIFRRLGIDAVPSGGEPRTRVRANGHDVGDALARLGVGDAAGYYRKVREATTVVRGKGSRS